MIFGLNTMFLNLALTRHQDVNKDYFPPSRYTFLLHRVRVFV